MRDDDGVDTENSRGRVLRPPSVPSILQMSGRLRVDLAGAVVSPRVRFDARPPRVLPWRDVRRILRAVDVSRPLGRRDLRRS